MSQQIASSAVPPLLVKPDGWAGNDGNWSTFQIAVGTPPQRFRTLPSTTRGEVWIPTIEGCEGSPYPDCATSRGVLDNDSFGFDVDKSRTWDTIGIYALPSPINGTDNGAYGLDHLSISSNRSFTLHNQTITGIATSDYWISDLGLGTEVAKFSGQPSSPSLLSAMKEQQLIPSLSYGYSAGASYRSVNASLVLGGYDKSMTGAQSIETQLNGTNFRSLTVHVRSIVMTNTLQGTVSATASSGALDVAIDSSVSQLWLPEAACDIFQDAFGLIYDSISGLYLATNTTAHALLHQSDPRITITIAADATSDVSTNIVFPYKAFDLHAGIPYWNGTAPYFPIRRATDNTYTLGRVFLQEAYVVVDWERRNMSISQANYEGGQADLASILPTEQTSQATLTKGQIAAVVLVAVSMIAVAIAAFLWFRRRKTTSNLHRHAHTTITSSVTKQQVAQELEANSSARSSELMSKPLHELSGEPKKLIFELPGEAIKMPQMESR